MASLTEEELRDNKPSPQLFEKSAPAQMGAVSAFVSHAWSDPGAAKYGLLRRFAADHGRTHGGAAATVWLDKACIDQKNIDASLACLPIFLAGCNSLLVLAGPTYATRLWCVVELFVYLRMGGRKEAVLVQLLEEDGAELPLLLSRFDAAKARCFLDEDRHKLLAVIEAAFGTFAPFNAIVRGIFADKLRARSREDGAVRV